MSGNGLMNIHPHTKISVQHLGIVVNKLRNPIHTKSLKGLKNIRIFMRQL